MCADGIRNMRPLALGNRLGAGSNWRHLRYENPQFDSDFLLYDMAKDAFVEPILNALVPPGSNSCAVRRESDAPKS